MKQITFLLFILFSFSNTLTAQSKPDSMPVYPGCEQAEQKMSCFREKLLNHISENFDTSLLHQIKDTNQVNMMISFNINFDGSLGNIKIDSPYKKLNAEMELVLTKVPKIIPAMANNEPISIQYQLPVSFDIKPEK